jgi:hypothetical protein
VDGPRPVESLRAGDHVLTRWGEPRPVRWIGRRSVDPYHHPWPNRVHPLRVAVGTFAASLPERAVLLSPDQGICVDIGDTSVLVPCGLLANDDSIVQVDIGTVTYWTVELDTHDLILTEGLAVETYLDAGKRDSFERNGAPMRLFADFSPVSDVRPWAMSGCLPLMLSGPLLDAARHLLAAPGLAENRAAAAG